MIDDYIRISIRSIRHQGTRSWLTMLGIFIGIATIVSLISLGQGMEDAINQMMSSVGVNLIYVMPGAGFQSMGSGATKLTGEDVDLIESVHGVNLAAGMTSKVAKVESHGESKFGFVSGLPTDKRQKIIEDMESIRIAEGRFFKDDEKFGVGVGFRVANGDFFSKPVTIGDRVTINEKVFRVVGTLEKIGSKDDDEAFYIPLETSEELFNDYDNYIVVMAQVKDGFDTAEVAENIKKKLRKDRGLNEGEEDFNVQTVEQMSESFGIILNVVNLVFLGIAGISLFVGGIGIMNTMYTSVLQRTREIGIMKAVGARNGDIMGLFIVESGVIGIAGGIVGVIIGLGLSKTVEFIAVNNLYLDVMKAHVSWQLIVGALAFSFIVGCISGTLPARQAAKLRPVEALRYE